MLHARSFYGTAGVVGVVMAILASSAGAATIATFSDPALNGSTPLFTVNLTTDTVSGGWSAGGLTLQVPLTGNVYSNAWFTMSDLTYTGTGFNGTTGGGVIKFFKQGDPISATPLIQISFDSAQIATGSFGGDDILSSNNVVITGSEIAGTLDEESFAFGFANQRLSPNKQVLTATATFTSSALPEPTAMLLLGLGIPALLSRRRRIAA